MSRRPQLPAPLRWASLGAMALVIAAGGACTGPGPEGAGGADAAPLPAIDLVERGSFPLPAHLESEDLAAGTLANVEIFEAGEALFHTAFNGLDGVGIARDDDGNPVARFSPPGPDGPSSQSCGECHSSPVRSAAGLANSNIAQDPDDDGEPPFNTRNTISVFGDGLLQLLAQEITEELQATRDEAAAAAAASPGTTVTRELRSKGTSYGSLAVVSDGGEPRFDLTQVEGIDPDLVVRPFGSKGTVPNVRTITAGPAQGGLGMQPEELVWKREDGGADADPDGDGVERELSVGDITAMTIYTASQETPTDVERLADLGWVAPPSDAELATLAKGRETFAAAGCADCHIPEMHLGDAVFEEPTLRGNGNYFDPDLAERDPGYDPERPVRFDLLTEAQAPRAEPHPDGGAIVRLYGDLKRHAMGRQLEEPAGPSGSTLAVRRPLLHDGERVRVPADVFLTSELWGVGNTGPWLHDGRAGTLREAVLLHGEDDPPAPGEPGRSEAQESRDAFRALAPQDQDALVSFLLSLRTFAPEGD